MKNILLLVVFSLSKFVSSQTIYSEYVGISSSFKTLKKINYNNEPSEPIVPMLAAFSSMGITAKYKMYIYSNCNYAFIKMTIEEVNMPGIPLGEESAELYVLDYNKYIFYDLKKFTYSIYKDPDFFPSNTISTNDSIYSTYIISKTNPNDTALITFNKSIPKCLTNKVILLNHHHGIQEIQTKNQYVKLTLYNQNSEFDIDEKVKFAKTKCTEAIKSKNYLFLK
jgi:hypothetical protein